MRKNKNKKQSTTPPAATLSNITASRKSRSKTRKPKYLSLVKLEELSPENTSDMPTTGANDRRHNQLDLFPLHPENLVDEKDNQEDNNVAYYFSSVDNGGAATLTGLLGANTSCSGCDGETLSPESLTYAYGGGQDSEEVEQLVRTAMRKQSRDQESSEEKWVSCCSETKSNVVVGVGICDNKRLSLKLDYQEIMDAWSDKGPLIVNVQSSCASQVVPDLLHDDLFAHPSINGWGSSGALWSVPEMSGSTSNGCIKVEEVHGEDWKIGRREASVLRYREKRQNRLFSKKIRYEVRKLNAEKRPRIKGRFVKRI